MSHYIRVCFYFTTPAVDRQMDTLSNLLLKIEPHYVNVY